ncbi:AAEL010566-PA [Aedes aegypti]|uniref:AAEL010566-PA n=1 Tax=Aedes aegypti TaxID=7159 RepID=Q16SL8_AEDAE|nr:AAEL010566-PA [Aedes aegypti]
MDPPQSVHVFLIVRDGGRLQQTTRLQIPVELVLLAAPWEIFFGLLEVALLETNLHERFIADGAFLGFGKLFQLIPLELLGEDGNPEPPVASLRYLELTLQSIGILDVSEEKELADGFVQREAVEAFLVLFVQNFLVFHQLFSFITGIRFQHPIGFLVVYADFRYRHFNVVDFQRFPQS